MGNLAFQDVDLLLSDIQRSAPNRELCGVYPRHTQRYFRALTSASAGSLQVTRRLSMAVFWGEAAPMPRGSVDHEPSHCRYGVWLHASRMFCNDAQPESRFHEIGSAGRDAGHCVRAARGGRKNLVRPELSYALPAPRPARQRVLRHAYAEWLSAADRIGASGG